MVLSIGQLHIGVRHACAAEKEMRRSTVLVARLQLQLHGRLAEEGIVYLFVRPNEFDELDVQHVILGID